MFFTTKGINEHWFWAHNQWSMYMRDGCRVYMNSYMASNGSCFMVTSHMRLRARDHYKQSTLVGGKRGAGPSLLWNTTLEGRMEYVSARWMWSLHGVLRGIEWIMFHGHLDCFENFLLEVALTQNRETMTLQTLITVDCILFLSCVRTCMKEPP